MIYFCIELGQILEGQICHFSFHATVIKRIQTKNNIVQLQNKVLDTQALYRERKRERKKERERENFLSISIVYIHTYKKKLTPLNWPNNSEPTSSLHKHQNQHKRFLLFSLSL